MHYFSEGITDGMKRVIFFLLAFFVSKSIGNNIFLLPTELSTDKKLLTKDSSIEHFRRLFCW
jgi:hypothetical protein